MESAETITFKKFKDCIDQLVAFLDEGFGAFCPNPVPCFRIFDFNSALLACKIGMKASTWNVLGNSEIKNKRKSAEKFIKIIKFFENVLKDGKW